MNWKYIVVLALILPCSCKQNKPDFAQERILHLVTNSSEQSHNEKSNTSGLFPELSGEELLQKLNQDYQPKRIASYGDARDYLYSKVDINDQGNLVTIYSQYEIPLSNSGPPRKEAYEQGVNAEHVFPKSYGARNHPAKADLYNIYPCQIDINSNRSNKPFGEIDDRETDEWYWKSDVVYHQIPKKNIDEYSENSDSNFEPREDKKGDIARAVFYFVTIYDGTANEQFFNGMKPTLLTWHKQDPVNEAEIERMKKIEDFQGNANPYVLDASLAERVFE